jgi:hypothetical protein
MIANALVNKCKFLVTRYGCGDFTFDLDAVMRISAGRVDDKEIANGGDLMCENPQYRI